MKKKRNRPQRPLYLSDDEYDTVKQRAKDKNLATAVYLRMKALEE